MYLAVVSRQSLKAVQGRIWQRRVCFLSSSIMVLSNFNHFPVWLRGHLSSLSLGLVSGGELLVSRLCWNPKEDGFSTRHSNRIDELLARAVR